MTMHTNYQELAKLLKSRISVISNTDLRDSNPAEQLRQLQSVSEAIEAWHSENRRNIPSQLNHYLQQSSLSKALDYLQQQQLI